MSVATIARHACPMPHLKSGDQLDSPRSYRRSFIARWNAIPPSATPTRMR